jgi:hypothetical protein
MTLRDANRLPPVPSYREDGFYGWLDA